MESQGDKKIRVKVEPELVRFIPDFLERRRSDVQEILKALEVRDFDRLQMIGHQMKGAGASCGFIPISEIGASIEEEALLKRVSRLPDLAQELAHYLSQLEVVFE